MNNRAIMDITRKNSLSTPYGSAVSFISPVSGSAESNSQFQAGRSGISSSSFSSPDYSETDDDSVSKTSSYKSFSTSVGRYECSRGEREPLLQSRDSASNAGLFNRTSASESSMQIHHISHEFISDVHSPSRAYSLLSKCRNALKLLKPVFLFLFAVALAVMLFSQKETSSSPRLMCVGNSSPQYFPLNQTFINGGVVTVKVNGPFPEDDDDDDGKATEFLIIGLRNGSLSEVRSLPEPRKLPLKARSSHKEAISPAVSRTLRFTIDDNVLKHMYLDFSCNCTYCVAISFQYYEEPLATNIQVIIGFVILACVYLLIVFEIVHRATAAILGSFACLAALSMLQERPSLVAILNWIEWETLCLLFGMMILVSIFAETGFFDYVALQAYKLSRGHVWRLITMLCFSVGIVSAVLDNVTTILLMTPVTVRLCQVLNLNPIYVLIAEVMFSNIGGTATAIGDPPNLIIVSNKDLKAKGIDFSNLSSHLSVGIVFCMILGFVFLRLLYCRIQLENPDPPIIAEMRREAELWRRSAERVPIVSPEEKTVKILLLQKTMQIEQDIRNRSRILSRSGAFHENLKDLEEKYAIRDRWLLMKCSVVIVIVIVCFFIHSTIPGLNNQIGWIALVGAFFLILLADINNLEDVIEKIEWTTLVFFAALFVLMRGLKELGLVNWLGYQVSNLILDVPEDSRLAVAIVAIIWISALASAFIDNIPFTTAMIPVILNLHFKTGLPLQPLVYSLAMGTCLGGNGTLIGASANVVCAGLAEQQGYRISFNKFFKVGFPMMLFTTAISMTYLLICHCEFSWGNK